MAPGESGGDLTGRLLGGRYRVTGQLGRGGMGVVCTAVDDVLGREVAVKVLRAYTDASAAELADLRTRMRREARAAARIRHSGVITVHDVADEDGLPVIVMELIDGPSLDDVIDERGVIGPREAAEIGAKVADALDAGHDAGVLHRDVKPGNVLLDRSGRVVLTDFGIASMEAPDDGASTKLTRSGELIGSLDYLAPERAQGQQPGPASDVWALGMTLYAAVEGSSPFRRTSVWSTLTAIVTEPLPEPRRAGPLAPVLRALMDKDPHARPSAAEARRLLEAVAAGEAPAVAPGPPPGTRTPTAPDVAAAAPGFGPPPAVAPPAGGGERGTTGTRRETPPDPGTRSPRRGRRGALVAGAAAAVLLIAGGITYALVGGEGDTSAGGPERPSPEASHPASPKGGKTRDTGEAKPRDSAAPSVSHTPEDRGGGTGDGAKDEERTGGDGEDGSGRGSDGGEGGGATGDGDSGGAGGSGGGSPAPDPGSGTACRDIGGGTFNCEVWRDATSYTRSGETAGTLRHGVNYFYCQEKLDRRERYGSWTNVWWARTDDDSGNRNVYVSAVYVKGGGNDEPLPGLPVC
ncbi:serine/threonine-protein kinase [Streptomyces sp. NA02950]|uniref:serine/threonine-protein kinase n=1 Tax=Streptomyces sp. NA02950 TaxID=2742137 RepID=UPI0020CAFE9E|nr:serine/threonine-protein kinase [Streptomyces sp. NA02950]